MTSALTWRGSAIREPRLSAKIPILFDYLLYDRDEDFPYLIVIPSESSQNLQERNGIVCGNEVGALLNAELNCFLGIGAVEVHRQTL